MGHAVRLGDGGRLEVVRSAPPEAIEVLRHTVRRLRAATGTGAVEIVSVTDDGDRLELVLAFAGRPPSSPVRGEVLAPIAASVSASIADLHQRNIVHGALAIDHVLVDAAGAVRLCGFGAATGSAAHDVLAFGALLRALLHDDDRSAAAEALRAVAVRCCVDDPDARPTMAAVTATLAVAPDRPRSIRAPRRVERRRRRHVPIAAAVAIVVAITAIAALPRRARADLPRRSVSATTTSTRPPATTTTTIASRVWPSSNQPLRGAGATWTFGEDDGVQLVGDWDCDGDATPAIVRVSDGTVWLLDEWPTSDRATARFVTTIDGATGAHVESLADCDDLVVETDDGNVRPALDGA